MSSETNPTAPRVHDVRRSYHGYTLFCHSYDPSRAPKGTKGRARLMDMDGRVVHQWHVSTPMHQLDLRPDGTLYYDTHFYGPIAKQHLYRIAPAGSMLWKYNCRIDHDYHIMGNGNVMIHCLAERVVPHLGIGMRRSPYIVEVSPQGDLVWEWHGEEHTPELTALCGTQFPIDWAEKIWLELQQQSSWSKQFPELTAGEMALMLNQVGSVLEDRKLSDMAPEELESLHAAAVASRTFDWAHNNTCEVLPPNASGACDGRFKEGNILFSYRNLDVIGVIDYPSGEIVWAWGPGELDGQHCPTMISNGHIFVFDNGWRRGWSRVVELDPLSERIVWEYTGTPKHSFNGTFISGVQPLPNGNVFICEGVHRRLFEVTTDKDIVWEYCSPADEVSLNRIYRATRYDAEYVEPLLGGSSGASDSLAGHSS